MIYSRRPAVGLISGDIAMTKLLTPILVILVIAMITAFMIGQIGGRTDRTAQKSVAEKVESGDEQAATDATTEGEETAAAQEEPAPVKVTPPHEMPLASMVEDAAVEQFNLKTFAGIVTKAKLEGLMTPEDGGQLTLFVPDDSAFDRMGEEARNVLVEGDFATADAFLKAHLVSGRYTLQELNAKAKDNTLTLTTLAGTKITLVREEGGPWAVEGPEGVKYFIMRPDALRANGVGQVINGVLPVK